MRRKLLAVVVLSVAPLLARAQAPGVPETRAFDISSLNTAFAMQGEFSGEYRTYPGWLELRLTRAQVRVSEHCPYKGRRVLSSLKFVLATTTQDGRWKIANEGPGIFPERVMRPGDVYDLGWVYFYIPIDDSVDLSRHWLVAQMEDVVLDDPEEGPRKGYAFAHSRKDIFSRPE